MLEELEADVVHDRVSVELALKKVIHFARVNFDLELSEEQMQMKLKQIKEGVNLERIQKQLGSISMITASEESI